MLQKIHQKVHGVIAWVLIVLIAGTFTLWGINYYLESHAASDAQAEVNGEPISKTDFSNTYQRLKRQATEKTGELTLKQDTLLKHRALQQLIFTRVVLQGAQSSGYLVTREQAESALLQIPQFQEDGQFSPEKFQQAMSSALYTPSVFLTKIQEGLEINQQRFSFAGTAFVLPEELSHFIALSRQTRTMDYVIIPEKLFEATAQVDEKSLHDYYDNHKMQFKVPEKVSIDYVIVSMNKMLSETHVSHRAIQQYYQDNMDAYTHPAQWQWAHILIRVSPDAKKTVNKAAYKKAMAIESALHHGETFSVAVKKNSDDVVSMAKNGKMPWVSELTINPNILTALQALKNDEISAPLKTQYGYEILQRVGYQAPKEIPLNEVKEQIRTILKTDKAQQVFSQMSDDLTNLSYQNPSSLKEVAKTLTLPVKTSVVFTRKGLAQGQGIASHKEVVQAAFSDEVLRDGNNSPVITINDNTLMVLRVHDHLPTTFMSFKDAQSTLTSLVTKEKSAASAEHYGVNWLKMLQQNLPVESEKYHLSWIPQNDVRRDDASLNPVILETVFKMPPLVNHQPAFQGVVLVNGDYAIVKLMNIQQGSVDSLDREERKMFKDESEAALGIIDYNLYIDGLMHRANIVQHSN